MEGAGILYIYIYNSIYIYIHVLVCLSGANPFAGHLVENHQINYRDFTDFGRFGKKTKPYRNHYILELTPPPSSSHHQDYSILSRESL